MMDEITSQGIRALKAGEKEKARTLLLSALEKNEDNSQAWLWLSGAVDSYQDRLECLQQVLRIDPNNKAAMNGLALLSKEEPPAGGPLEISELPEEKENPVVPLEVEAVTVIETPPMTSEEPDWVPVQEVALEMDTAPVPEQESILEPAAVSAIELQADTLAVEPMSLPEARSEPEEDYRLPESFFDTTEKNSETFPDWMSVFNRGENPADGAQTEQTAAENETFQADIPTSPFVMDEGAAQEARATPEIKATPISAEKPKEKALLKFRPSLATTIFVYGMGAIIFFFVLIQLMRSIANFESLVSILLVVIVVIGLLLMLGLVFVGTIKRVLTSYILTNRRVYLEKGIFKRSRKSIPLPRIKNLSIKQGLLQKIIGTGNLLVESEGPEGDEKTTLLDVSGVKRVIRRIESVQRDEN
jgi:membrane protein YdbS with pleckstrin-like domain